MDKFYTLMLIPEKNQKIKSMNIPSFAVKLAAVGTFGILLFLSIILVDYWNLMQNVIDNKHISLENKQLREQLQIFQMKINSLTNDVERISTFEQKLRTITGLEREKLTKSYFDTLQVIQEQNQNILDDTTESDAKNVKADVDVPEDLLESVPRKKIPKPKLEILPEATPLNAPTTIPLDPIVKPSTTTFLRSLFMNSANAQTTNKEETQDWTPPQTTAFHSQFLDDLNLKNFRGDDHFQELLRNHQQAFLNIFGISDNYEVTRLLSQLVERSGSLSFNMAKFDFQFEVVNNFTSHLEQKLHELDQFLLDRDSMLQSTPILMPTNGWITSYFGPRINPYTGRLKMHEGIDVGAPHGASIYAPADGMVVFSGIKPGFGKHVQIDHGYGIETLYAHSERLHIKTGQRVTRGTLLANVGSTGHSTGPHLHYEVRINGVPVDPFYFILE